MTEQYLKHTPREHKYVLAQRIRESTLNLAIFLVEAEKRFYSKTALNNLDIENAKLKRLWYVMFELWFLGYKHNQKYDHTIALHRFNTLSIKLGEIGRMIGGLYKFESVRHQ